MEHFWLKHTLLVEGASGEVNRFMNENQAKAGERGRAKSLPLVFGATVPDPAEGVYTYHPDHARLRLAGWGVPWDLDERPREVTCRHVSQTKLKGDRADDPHWIGFNYDFYTVDGAPLAWLDAVAARYPQMCFRLDSYHGESKELLRTELYENGKRAVGVAEIMRGHVESVGF